MNKAIAFSHDPMPGPGERPEVRDDSLIAPAADKPAPPRERNILFVDDDERFLNLCKRRLEASEYAIFTANCAEAALEVLKGCSMDIVVSDMSMPGRSGAELMQEIETTYPDVIRIIISGKSDLADAIEAINKGHVYKYITKPFNDKDLKLTIYQTLLEKERREADERRRKERQELVKRRAWQLGEMVVQTRFKADKAYDECIALLGNLVAGHGDAPLRIGDLAERLARAAGATEALCQQVKIAAVLQDLSTAGRSLTPVSEMDQREKEAYLRHPVDSARLLSELAPFKEAAFIVKNHHERYDGTGFPSGLSGRDIPWGARVVALATAFETIRERRNLSDEDTMLLLTEAGERYDPDLLAVLSNLEPVD